jgi:hypothetical protein
MKRVRPWLRYYHTYIYGIVKSIAVLTFRRDTDLYIRRGAHDDSEVEIAG